jgi:DedD protein
MGLLSFFQRRAAREGAPPAAVEPGSVEAARTRARRRLIGAAVLLAVGVVGFPLVFDTAPRPLPVDIPIEIPAKDAVAPLAPPKAAPGRSVGASAVGRVAAAEPAPLLTESASEAGRELPAPVEKAEAAEPRPAPAPSASATAPRAVPAEPRPAASKPPARPASAESARALAAIEGRSGESGAAPTSDAAPAGGRFVVQVGAFSEATSARDARARVEKLGLKAYTQVVETSGGKRIRVRVGPYGDRGEAEKAAAQIKQAGLSSAVLTL